MLNTFLLYYRPNTQEQIHFKQISIINAIAHSCYTIPQNTWVRMDRANRICKIMTRGIASPLLVIRFFKQGNMMHTFTFEYVYIQYIIYQFKKIKVLNKFKESCCEFESHTFSSKCQLNDITMTQFFFVIILRNNITFFIPSLPEMQVISYSL